jgi:hypothetical protein
MQTVSRSKVVTAQEAIEEPLPVGVQEALGELVGAAKEGLLALSVGVGLRVLFRDDGLRRSRRCAGRGASTTRSGPPIGTGPMAGR